MGDQTSRITTGLRRSMVLCALLAATIGHPASAVNAAGSGTAAAGTAGDTLSRRNEKIIFYERSFHPSSYDTPVQLPAVEGSGAHAPATIDHTTPAAPETVQGFRIQVINTNSYDESAATRNALLAAFDTWWVYVMFDSPTYRVRIGDFQSRLAAKNALEQILAKGFPNALLVPDKVVLHLPPRMPLPQPIDSTIAQ